MTHRALLLGAVAEGTTTVRGPLAAGDTLSTARIVRRLGATVRWGALEGKDGDGVESAAGGGAGADVDGAASDVDQEGAVLSIDGIGELVSTAEPLDCGNAGTAARLLTGLLAGRAGEWTLDGDASLRSRPMARVADPLRRLGADIDGDRLPLRVRGSSLAGGRVEVDVPSAQVKSALLLAGLSAREPLTVVQHALTRDHTERMLPRFGVEVSSAPGRTTVVPGRPRACDVTVPGDPSSAAFLVVAALLVPESRLLVRDVGLWPRRTGFLRALKRAEADVMIMRREATGAADDDPRGDLGVTASPLRAFDIAPEDVPDLVDEVPILALAAARAEGTSRFAGLAELRHKESDRIAAITSLLMSLGVPVEVGEDEIRITGVSAFAAPPRVDHDDHRLAMTAAIARLVMGEAVPEVIESAEISYPGFGAALRTLAGS